MKNNVTALKVLKMFTLWHASLRSESEAKSLLIDIVCISLCLYVEARSDIPDSPQIFDTHMVFLHAQPKAELIVSSKANVCVWVGTFVRMCVSNFQFTLGPSLVSKSTSSVFNRPSSVLNRLSLVFKSMSLVFLRSAI